METLEFRDYKELNCGENNFQAAKLASFDGCVDYEVISRNKDIEYLDYLNLSKTIRICAEFFDVNSCTLVKNNLICAVALGSTQEEAFLKILDCAPLCIAKSTIGFSKEVDFATAKLLIKVGVKNILAPSFSKEAFSLLLESEINLIALKTPLHEVAGFYAKDIKITPFGALIQEQNNNKLTKETFCVVSQTKPTQIQVEDAVFGWKVAKHLQSNCAVVAKDLCTKAIVQGEINDFTSCEKAMDCACENSKDGVLVIDGAIENIETLNASIQGRIGLIVEAGDHKKSGEILKAADKYEMSVIFTKTRNYKY